MLAVVTGSNSEIGVSICKYLLSKDYKVIALFIIMMNA